MASPQPTRRCFASGLVAAGCVAAGAPLHGPARAQSSARIVVIGGGFGGATCARALKRLGFSVTLVEANAAYAACPMSNACIVGLRDMSDQLFGYDALGREGVEMVYSLATGIDAQARAVTLADGARIPYDRLVLAPGIEFVTGGLAGYDAASAMRMPHAWNGAAQMQILRDQLRAMADGGTFVISVPDHPYRCPPAPYERASLVAHYFRQQKPRSKIIVLDAKDSFPRQKLFQAAWARLYPGLIDWVPLSSSGKVTSVDASGISLGTDFDNIRCDVANVIPPQRAGAIARIAGIADRSGWCPVDPLTFESTLQANIHVIGDAALLGAVPRSASAAHAEALACARAIAALFGGHATAAAELASVCHVFNAPNEAFAIAGVFRAGREGYADTDVASGPAVADEPQARGQAARQAAAWYEAITHDVFGQG